MNMRAHFDASQIYGTRSAATWREGCGGPSLRGGVCLAKRGRTERQRTPEETVAKMRESTTLPLCRAAHLHPRTPVEGVLQQSPEQPDPEPREGTRPKLDVTPV